MVQTNLELLALACSSDRLEACPTLATVWMH